MSRGLIKCLTVSLILAVVIIPSARVSAAATDEEKCQSGRAKAKGKHEQCVEKWLANYYQSGEFDTPKALEKLAKCRAKYALAWTKLQGLGTTCAVGSRYTDNGDGTLTDNLTGLVWEKKTTIPGSGPDLLGDRHDVDNYYTWSTGSPWGMENGTVFTDFLANLNAGGGFAGSSGWRLPTFVELETILQPEHPCSTNPCIDPSFGSTQTAFYPYWSSTISAVDSIGVWSVFFGNGTASDGNAASLIYARAVRGGL